MLTTVKNADGYNFTRHLCDACGDRIVLTWRGENGTEFCSNVCRESGPEYFCAGCDKRVTTLHVDENDFVYCSAACVSNGPTQENEGDTEMSETATATKTRKAKTASPKTKTAKARTAKPKRAPKTAPAAASAPALAKTVADDTAAAAAKGKKASKAAKASPKAKAPKAAKTEAAAPSPGRTKYSADAKITVVNKPDEPPFRGNRGDRFALVFTSKTVGAFRKAQADKGWPTDLWPLNQAVEGGYVTVDG